MKIRWNRFNIYLSTALVLGLACGCSTSRHKEKKVYSTLRIHIEVNPDAARLSNPVLVHGFSVNVQTEPIITEANVKRAKVIDVLGGFEISLQFDRQGSWLLEQYTSAGRGKHLAIFSQWSSSPENKLNKGKWLASPYIPTHITDGMLMFTPDATREEADQLVLGLNNVARKIQAESLTE